MDKKLYKNYWILLDDRYKNELIELYEKCKKTKIDYEKIGFVSSIFNIKFNFLKSVILVDLNTHFIKEINDKLLFDYKTNLISNLKEYIYLNFLPNSIKKLIEKLIEDIENEKKEIIENSKFYYYIYVGVLLSKCLNTKKMDNMTKVIFYLYYRIPYSKIIRLNEREILHSCEIKLKNIIFVVYLLLNRSSY